MDAERNNNDDDVEEEEEGKVGGEKQESSGGGRFSSERLRMMREFFDLIGCLRQDRRCNWSPAGKATGN